MPTEPSEPSQPTEESAAKESAAIDKSLAHPRQVYVRRRGRMTRGQERALDTLRDSYCVDPSVTPLAEAFAQVAGSRELGVEIGFGMGQATTHWAEQCPEMNLLGVEVYEPGIGALLLNLKQRNIQNVRVVEADARTLFEEWVPEGSLSQINLFFPDPWPKKRHASRRIVQHDTVALYASRLRAGGTLRIATDWQPYAQWILECVDANADLTNKAGGYAERAPERPVTNFEARGLRLGHGVWDFWYERK